MVLPTQHNYSSTMTSRGHSLPTQRFYLNWEKKCGLSAKQLADAAAWCITWRPPELLSPLSPFSSHFLFEVCVWIAHYAQCHTNHQAHISQHLLLPNYHAKALSTTSQHDCKDLFTPLPHYTTTTFFINIPFLGARLQICISGENLGGLAWV